jgi:hypothetical protein
MPLENGPDPTLLPLLRSSRPTVSSNVPQETHFNFVERQNSKLPTTPGRADDEMKIRTNRNFRTETASSPPWTNTFSYCWRQVL